MEYSKSFAHFAPPEQQRQASTHTRARRRSSLDTFVIPGRTRLPSSKASVFDFQVTQGLLNSNLLRLPRRNMTSAEETLEWSPETSPAGCIPRRGHASGPLHHRIRPDIVKRPAPRFGGREVIINPPQRPRPPVKQQAPQTLAPVAPQEYVNTQTYDGADDWTTGSRLTSTTWSTISNRFVSDSSGSSRTTGSSYYRDEFNRLAEKHGLSRLEVALDDDQNHSETKTTTKTHQPGWLARKLFRRSSSTYTLKAKTTYKPIPKKKSFGGIPVPSEDTHKNILKNKTLEELSRLGGRSVLTLPPEFAVDKLTLPICLSATATYLYLHGRNAPGIFRISGQTTIVNALYDFYDHQFANADAGSPSKVEQTVGYVLLPSHIEHTVPDVASFFKRILIDLPGGLLGSVELFEALRNITTNLAHDPELSEHDLTSLKAKMIALAISSVPSDCRTNLIQAVLGLVSYLGHEAEKTQTEHASAHEDQASSELMNYRSLGVVLGPLLLGDLTDRALHGSGDSHSGAPPTSLETDGAKKFRKHKRKQSDMKLDQSATLAAFVDRANRTAIVTQQLLLLWPDVIKQLRDINTAAGPSLKSRSKHRLKKLPSHTGSGLTIKTSEEEMRFLDILRGRTLPEEFRGAVKMKSNIRMTSRSPISRGAISPSEDENRHDAWLLTGSEELGNGNRSTNSPAERAARDNQFAANNELQSPERNKVPLADDTRPGFETRTNSDDAMEKMSMGTILPPLQIKSSSSSPKGFLRLVDPSTETPRKMQNFGSPSKTPETALRDAPPAETSRESDESQLQISMRKPLPPIGDAQRAELSFSTSEDTVLDPPPRLLARSERPDLPHHDRSSTKSSIASFSSRKARQSAERTIFPFRQSGQWPSSPTKQRDEQAAFPPRQSSLPMEKHLALKPIETYPTLAEYKASADTYMSPPKFNVSGKASEAQTDRNEVPDDGPRSNNVKVLAQKFAEASRAMRRGSEQAKETAMPRVYAYLDSLPAPKSPMLGLDDPFLSTESNNVSKESLIPRPVREAGRGRESRSISPPKRAAPKVPAPRRQSFRTATDRDAEIVQKNTTSKAPASPDTGEGKTYEEMMANSNGTGVSKQPSTQILDTNHHSRSAASLHRLLTHHPDSPTETHRIHDRSISFAEPTRPITHYSPDSPLLNARANRNSSPARPNSYLNASDALKPLERHASINTTMYNEICRLRSVLQQMGEEREAKDRRIRALEEVQGGNPIDIGTQAKGSFGKGGLQDEVRKARRESCYWKTRAEVAERRLSDRSWKNETADPEQTEPMERPEGVEKPSGEKEMANARDVHGDSPGSWKTTPIGAETQSARINRRLREEKEIDLQKAPRHSPNSWKSRAPIREDQFTPAAGLTEKGPYSGAVRTTPSPLTAKVYVAVEREGGEREESRWDWPGMDARTRSIDGETDTGGRRRPAETNRGSHDGSSGFASPLNGFG